jgi:hypothetical protein
MDDLRETRRVGRTLSAGARRGVQDPAIAPMSARSATAVRAGATSVPSGRRAAASRWSAVQIACTAAAGSARRRIHEGDFDEIIVSTLPKKRSKWLRRDLIRQIERLGLPVTAVVPRQQSLIDALDERDDMKRNIIGIGGGMAGGGGVGI